MAKATKGPLVGQITDNDERKKGKANERISQTFQRWLLICIVVAYLITSTFTFILQNGMAKIETQEIFTTAINDVESDIMGKSDVQLLSIAEQVKDDYLKYPEMSLQELADKYKIKEINVVVYRFKHFSYLPVSAFRNCYV